MFGGNGSVNQYRVSTKKTVSANAGLVSVHKQKIEKDFVLHVMMYN